MKTLSLYQVYLQYSRYEQYFVIYKILTSCWTEGGRRREKERAGLLTHWKPRPPTLQENLVSKFVLRRSMFHKSLVDKEMLTRYLWLPPSWIEIILVTAVQLMPTSNERPSFPCSSTFPPTSFQHGEAGLIRCQCGLVSQWGVSRIVAFLVLSRPVSLCASQSEI